MTYVNIYQDMLLFSFSLGNGRFSEVGMAGTWPGCNRIFPA